MTGAEIEVEARKWLGVPFRKRGRDRRRGLDCIGLVVRVGQAFGVPFEDRFDYTMYPREDNQILAEMRRWLIPEPPGAMRPGLIAAMAEISNPGHIGICSRKFDGRSWRPHIIHARRIPPQVCEHAWDSMPRVQCRLIGLFSYPGMEA